MLADKFVRLEEQLKAFKQKDIENKLKDLEEDNKSLKIKIKSLNKE